MGRSPVTFHRMRPYFSRRGGEGPSKFAHRDRRPLYTQDYTDRGQRSYNLPRREGEIFGERGQRPFRTNREDQRSFHREGDNRPLPLYRRLGEKVTERDQRPFPRRELGPDRRAPAKRAGERAFDCVKRRFQAKVSRWRVPAPTCAHHKRDCGSSHLHFSMVDEKFHWACEMQPDHHEAHVQYKWSDIFAAARFGGCDGGGYEEIAQLSRDLWRFLPREERADEREDLLAEELPTVNADKREGRTRVRQHPYSARPDTWRRESSRTNDRY